MPDLFGFPMALNQEVPLGSGYPAEAFRAQHFGSTKGGNGVDTPTALKVSAQPAPNGTIAVAPGGATLVSTYAGQEGQSYHAYFGAPLSLNVSPTGSAAGGRTDLVVVQLCDPDHDLHWSYEGEYPIPAEIAATLDFKRIHVFEGLSEGASLDFPHVELAEIKRPANTTIVTNDHIRDLRQLADPKNHIHMRGNNLISDDRQSLHSGTTIWPNDATHYMKIPEFATNVVIRGSWETVAANRENRSQGTAVIALVHPDGSEIKTQQTRWRNVRDGDSTRDESLNIHNSDSRPVPAKFRGQTVRVEMRATKISGPNVYMDGNSSWAVTLYFEQEIA